ncbi:MAG: 3'-5' exonuclease [Chitinophagales bacterium]
MKGINSILLLYLWRMKTLFDTEQTDEPKGNDNQAVNEFAYLDELNPVQRQAVEQMEGPVMVIAGPGSGKTRVLTYRIAHIIKKGTAPYRILSLTFTNKSAREMKERIEKIVGQDAARQLWMGTFHSIFARILRVEAEKLGYPANFTIYDTQDSKNLLKNIVKEQNLNPDIYKPNVVYNRISNAKNNLISPQAYKAHAGLMENDRHNNVPQIAELYERYLRRCRQAGAMDFDDLLVNMYGLLKRLPEVLEKYQNKFQFLMVDEFQDTNLAQYLIIRTLAGKHKNICVVGDDAQSIYAFRGATIENILSFEKDYKNVKTFRLEQNYRSTKAIVRTANEVINHNKNQITKEIWTSNDDGDKIKLIEAANDTDEAKMVAGSIFETRLRNHFRNEDFAILYRTNAQSRLFEEALRKQNIPYRVYGGLSFFQRKEIKDMMAYLRLTVNNNDEEALRRVINYPKRGIGKTTTDKMAAFAAAEQKPLWEIASNIHLYQFSPRVKTGVGAFVNMIRLFMKHVQKEDAFALAQRIGRMSGLNKELHSDKSVEGISRQENIQELFNSIKEFTDSKKEEAVEQPDGSFAAADSSLGAYLQEVSLLTDMDENEEDSDNKVKMMTVHSAKGLEFPAVYIVGLEEELFPSKRSKTQSDIEEERRLFYVAITRAEKQLSLSYANCRYKFGNLVYSEKSRFVEEISPLHLEMLGGKPSVQERSFGSSNAYDSFKDSIGNNVRSAEKRRREQQLKQYQPPAELIKNFKASPIPLIKEGSTILHLRFGMGEVLKVEGAADKPIALIEFEHHGEKKIMLKFAKLMVVG